MGESDELYADVNYIKHKVETLEKISLLDLRSNKVLYESYVTLLKSDEWLFKVYIEVDGIKSQNDIATNLGITAMKVSRKIKVLREHGLIENFRVIGKQRIYIHSVAEKAFRLVDL